MTQTPKQEYMADVVVLVLVGELKAAADTLAESLHRHVHQDAEAGTPPAPVSDDSTPPAPVSDELAPDTEGLPS
jgi:hypothetical protein